ncbi:MAG: AMP-binding protein, partial [Tumebacillaceae bacterium]
MVEKPVGTTLVDLVRFRALQQPDRPAFTFLAEEQDVTLTYADLDRRARALGAALQQVSKPGERALLLYPPGHEYLVAFFGCLFAGILAVPAYPPRLNGSLDRLQAVVQDAQATLALTTESIRSKVEHRFADTPGLQGLTWMDTEAVSLDFAENWKNLELSAENLAFLQYTSGSTSTPKGVMLSHGNLLHNLELIQESFDTTAESKAVIWLPPYHDMGLIGGILQPLYAGFHATLMSPFAFMQRPLQWLEEITRNKARVSGGPNFAYDLCVQKITEEQKASLDLSTWDVAFTGAEPIRKETLDRFAEAFASCGFRREAFYPCYGLAEATLFVTGGFQQELPVVQAFDADALEQNRVQTVAEEQAGARLLVSSGQPRMAKQQVEIVDPQTGARCAGEQVGEIWVAGPSVAQGYWRREEQTRETFGARLATGEGPFLRTGDLGFVRDGELYVTGRLKDLIIIRGRNFYPQDIEFTMQESHVALRPGCGAAFTVDVDGEERLVVVQEIERQHRKADLAEVVECIRQAVSQEHQLPLHAVVLIRPATAPLTSSGKIQRHACRERYLHGTLDVMKLDVLDGVQAVVGDVGEMQDGAHLQEITREQLLEMTTTERLAAVERHLQAKAAGILRMEFAKVDLQKPLGAFGLDSLMAVELKDALEESFGVVLPLVTFLEGPSLAQVAAEVVARVEAQEIADPREPATTQSAHAPLSYGQRALWFMQRLAPESTAYNIAHAVRIPGALQVDALRSAFAKVVQRHPQLRTVFPMLDEQPIQVVPEQFDLAFDVQDASALDEATLRERLTQLAHTPFDLANGPLLRAHLFSRSAEEHVLLLTVHHIIVDFWSLGVFLHELQQLYMADVQGKGISFTLE